MQNLIRRLQFGTLIQNMSTTLTHYALRHNNTLHWTVRKVSVHDIFIDCSTETPSGQCCRSETLPRHDYPMKETAKILSQPARIFLKKAKHAHDFPELNQYKDLRQPKRPSSYCARLWQKLLIQPASLTSEKQFPTALVWLVLAWKNTHLSLLKSLMLPAE